METIASFSYARVYMICSSNTFLSHKLSQLVLESVETIWNINKKFPAVFFKSPTRQIHKFVREDLQILHKNNYKPPKVIHNLKKQIP